VFSRQFFISGNVLRIAIGLDFGVERLLTWIYVIVDKAWGSGT